MGGKSACCCSGSWRGWLGHHTPGSVMGLLRTEAAMSHGRVVVITDMNFSWVSMHSARQGTDVEGGERIKATYGREDQDRCYDGSTKAVHRTQVWSRCPKSRKRSLPNPAQSHCRPRKVPRRWGIRTTGRSGKRRRWCTSWRFRDPRRAHACAHRS